MFAKHCVLLDKDIVIVVFFIKTTKATSVSNKKLQISSVFRLFAIKITIFNLFVVFACALKTLCIILRRD